MPSAVSDLLSRLNVIRETNGAWALVWGAQTVCMALFVLSVAGYGGAWHRYFELASHFRLQYLFGALGCLLFFILWRPQAWSVLALVTVVINALALAPWYTTRPRPAHDGVELKVLLTNLNYGNRQHAAVLALIKEEGPDVVVCQEVTAAWARALAPLHADYPFAVTVPAHGGNGIALYSRWPLAESEVLGLGMVGRPGIFARVKPHGREVSFLTLHPPTPLEEKDFVARNRQFTEAAAFAASMPGPKVLIGDLNNTLWSPFFARFEAESGLRDVRRASRGILPTWPTQLPPLMRIPIDHCLVSPEVGVAEVRTGPHVGSDHLPLIVRLTIP